MTSLADALTSTGMIPPMSGNDLQSSDTANQNKQSKAPDNSETAIVSKGLGDVNEKLTKFSEMKPPEMIPYKEDPKPVTPDAVQQGYVFCHWNYGGQ
jgi:hypothetical protein